ncbi:MAG: hypothetical protein U1E59_13140 [Amaricoccus sp.]
MHEVLYKVPEYLLSAYDSGEVIRYGAILKNVADGRIIAHMQETGLGQSLASTAVGQIQGLTGGLSPLGFATGAVQVWQNEQIKQALGVLQQLQVANLALSAVGIGISAAGFAVTAVKLDRIKSGIEKVAGAVGRVGRSVDELREDQLDRELAHLRAACRQVDEAWLLRDPERQWQDAARSLHEHQEAFQAAAVRQRDRSGPSDDLFALLVEAWLLAAGTRIAARLSGDEMGAALAASREAAGSVRALTSMIDDTDFLPADALRAGDAEARRRLAVAGERVQAFRDREDMVETRPHLIRHLIDRGISGRAHLEAARRETRTTALLLPVDADASATPLARADN